MILHSNLVIDPYATGDIQCLDAVTLWGSMRLRFFFSYENTAMASEKWKVGLFSFIFLMHHGTMCKFLGVLVSLE